MTSRFKTFHINSSTPKKINNNKKKIQKGDCLTAFKCISLPPQGKKLADYKSNVKDSAENEVACCAAVYIYI